MKTKKTKINKKQITSTKWGDAVSGEPKRVVVPDLESYLRVCAGRGAHSRRRARRAVNLWAAAVMRELAPYGGVFIKAKGLTTRPTPASAAPAGVTTSAPAGSP